MLLLKYIRSMYHYMVFSMIFCGVNIRADEGDSKPEVWINVFVHGIMSVKPHVGISNFIRFMVDDVRNTVYSETVRLMRDDNHFYQNQAMQELGLHIMNPSDMTAGNASGAMAIAFEQISQFTNPDRHICNEYYTYGWSGLMSVTQRYCDAIELYRSVARRVDELKKEGINPKVRIMGYSHGGNVVLNLGLVRRQENNPLPLVVDELFLLGMPVQFETDYLVNDPMFEKIYHIYSRGDRIQKLDFFSFNRFFSQRLFKPRKGFKLPEKLLQIQLKCTRDLVTICGDAKKEAMNYKFHNKSIQTGRSSYLRDSSPGHTELWFFGWTPLHYRCNFALYPFPSAMLVPLIARYVENFQERTGFEKPTLIDIRPEQEIVLVSNQRCRKTIVFGKFLPKTDLCQLSDRIMNYAPEGYTDIEYNNHIQDSFMQAQEWHAQQNSECHWQEVEARRDRKQERKARKRWRQKKCIHSEN